jgi:hypothetical protein
MIEKKIMSRIYGHGRGWVFSSQDFLDISKRGHIDTNLSRLLQKGSIRRVIRGLYEYPKYSDLLGQFLSPDLDKVAYALARKYRWKIKPNEATILNLQGKSTQVPGQIVYESNGPNKKYKIGNNIIQFKKILLSSKALKTEESHKKNFKNFINRKYRLSFDDYQKMYETQNALCAICYTHKDTFFIDHDHKTGKVRGLLCPRCNSGLGQFKDSVFNLTNAINYLKKSREEL